MTHRILSMTYLVGGPLNVGEEADGKLFLDLEDLCLAVSLQQIVQPATWYEN